MDVCYGITTDVLVIRRHQNLLFGFVELVLNQCNLCIQQLLATSVMI